MILVDTFVAGLPRTKGSLARRPNGSLYDSVVDSGKWRALMAGAVRDDYRQRHGELLPGTTVRLTPGPCPGPVLVSALFTLPVDPLAYGAGDLDKLLRNLLDALGTKSKNPRYNGGVILDDNQVTDFGNVRKRGPSPHPGVRVVVSTTSTMLLDAW